MKRRLAVLALAACLVAACAEKKHAPEKAEKSEPEPASSAEAVTHGGAQHASTHEPDAAPPPAADPYYFKDDEPTRAALQPKFKACYQKGLNVAGKKDVSGRLQFLLQIGPTGKALQINPTATTGLTDPIIKCLETTALAGKFAVTNLPFNRWVKFDLNFQ